MSEGLYDFTRFVSALFPFKPTLKLMSSVLYDEGELAGPLLHLLALTAAFGLAAVWATGAFRKLARNGLPRHPTETDAQIGRAAWPRAGDRSVGRAPGLSVVRDAWKRPA